MMTFTELAPAASELPEPFTDRLRLAAAAYLARFKGSSRAHTESDLRWYLSWCAGRGLDPLAAQRPHLELYIRWMQEIRRFKPSTVSRRFSVVAGFYRTCVIDGLMQHSPAEHVRCPAVPVWTSGTSRSPATPIHAPRSVTTGPAPTWTATPTTSWPPTCPQQPDQPASPRLKPGETPRIAEKSAESAGRCRGRFAWADNRSARAAFASIA
jgi:hypothetical protein